MKFKFESGDVIECSDERIAELLRADKRYTEVTPKGKGKKAEEVKEVAPEGENVDGEVQE